MLSALNICPRLGGGFFIGEKYHGFYGNKQEVNASDVEGAFSQS